MNLEKSYLFFKETKNTKNIIDTFRHQYPTIPFSNFNNALDEVEEIQQCPAEEIYCILDEWSPEICQWLAQVAEPCRAVYFYFYHCPSIDHVREMFYIQKELGIVIGIDTYYSLLSLLAVAHFKITPRIDYCFFYYASKEKESLTNEEIEKNVALLLNFLHFEKATKTLNTSSAFIKNNIDKCAHGSFSQTQWQWGEEDMQLTLADKTTRTCFNLKEGTIGITEVTNTGAISHSSKPLMQDLNNPQNIDIFFNKLHYLKILHNIYINIGNFAFM